MSVYGEAKAIIKDIFGDGKIHTTKEIRRRLDERNVDYKSKKNIIGSILFGLKDEGFIEAGEKKGEYILCKDSLSGENIIERNTNDYVFSTEENVSKSDIDFDDFIVIKPQRPKEPELKVSIFEVGEIRLNSPLLKILNSRSIEVFLEKDCGRILLKPDGKNPLSFTKAGIAKNRDIVKALERLEIEFPIVYIVKWNNKYNIWEGTISQ